MARVALDGVWKIYEQRGKAVEAVRDLTLDCADGEFLAIVGPSGCGKSSTMRMIAGLEAISRGTITIGDRVVNNVKPADRNIAMVFENYALYPHLTVRENIVLSLEVRGVKPAEIKTLLDRAVSTLDIGDILKRKPRAVVRRPKTARGDCQGNCPEPHGSDHGRANLAHRRAPSF